MQIPPHEMEQWQAFLDTLCDRYWDENYERLRRPLMAYIQKATLERFDRSQKQWDEYGQQVYRRNFDQVVEALL